MKTNLILDVQGVKKMLKSILFVAAILSMNYVDARTVNQKGQAVVKGPRRQVPGRRPVPRAQPRRMGQARGVQGQAREAQEQREEPAEQRTMKLTEKQVLALKLGLPEGRNTPGSWIEWFLEQDQDDLSDPEIAEEVNTVLKSQPPFITEEKQIDAVNRHWQKMMRLKQNIQNVVTRDQAQQETIAKLEKEVQEAKKIAQELAERQKSPSQQLQSASEVTIPEPVNRGWFAPLTEWADYFNTPGRAAVAGAALAGAAGLSAWAWGPAVALAVGIKSLLGIAGLSTAVSQIRFSWQTGKLTEAQAIQARANLLRAQLANNATYPIIPAELEALKGLELASIEEQQQDPIFDGARVVVMAETKKSAASATDKESAAIFAEINNCRKLYDKGDLQDYVQNIENAARDKDAEQSIAKWQAYVSEYARTKNKIARGLANKEQSDVRLQQAEQAAKDAEAKLENAKEFVKQGVTAAAGAVKGVVKESANVAVEAAKEGTNVAAEAAKNWWNQPPAPKQVNPFVTNPTPKANTNPFVGREIPQQSPSGPFALPAAQPQGAAVPQQTAPENPSAAQAPAAELPASAGQPTTAKASRGPAFLQKFNPWAK